MKRFRLIFYLLVFFLSFGRFLPVSYAPEFAHHFFSGFGSWLFVPGFCFLLVWIFICFCIATSENPKKNQLKESTFVLIFFVSIIFSIPSFTDFQNKITIWANNGREPENFFNPFLGTRMIKCSEDNLQCIGAVMFKYNETFFEYDALVFSPRHDLERLEKSDEGLENVKEIYNKDWLKYHRTD